MGFSHLDKRAYEMCRRDRWPGHFGPICDEVRHYTKPAQLGRKVNMAAAFIASDGGIDRISARVNSDAANQMFAGEAHEKGLEFRIHAVGDQIEADAVAIKRVVSNLVTNAIRDTAEGGAVLGARIELPRCG